MVVFPYTQVILKFITYSSSDSGDPIAKNNEDLDNVNQWMTVNKLQIHPTKSKDMFIGSSCNIKNKIPCTPVLINNVAVPRVTSCCTSNEWDNHIEFICGKVGAGIAIIKRLIKTLCFFQFFTNYL